MMKNISRNKAKQLGCKKYFTGKPCKNGHVDARFVKNWVCCSCHKHDNIKWRKDNKEYFKQINKKYHNDNMDYYAIKSRYRYEFLTNATPTWYEKKLVNQVYLKRDELNKKWGTNFEVDHIVPLISDNVCGLHCWANLQLLDASVNNSKRNSYKQDW